MFPDLIAPPVVRPLGGDLWVWDEGEVDPEFGGNKVRKLARLLPEALARGASEVVTSGGIGSNHVLATCLLGRRVGISTHAVLFDQPDRPDVRRTLARIEAAAASVTRVTTAPEAVARSWALARSGRAWIPVGGTSATGVAGWRDAAAEVAGRVRRGELPRPDRVVVAVGTGGTAAGLLAGFAGLRTEVVGARVVPAWAAGAGRIRHLARSVAVGAPPPLRIVDSTLGGYGVVHDDALAAQALGAARGLSLELTYTAKAFSTCVDEHRDGGVTWFVATADARARGR